MAVPAEDGCRPEFCRYEESLRRQARASLPQPTKINYTMLSRFKSVVVLSPHTDDGELGAGGTIGRLLEVGARVYNIVFSTAQQSLSEIYPADTLKSEHLEAASILGVPRENIFIHDYEVRKLNYERQGILEKLIIHRDNLLPDLVIMPVMHDVHQDHVTIALEGLRAFKNTTIWGYELIWNNMYFKPTVFINLERRHVDLKVKALQAYRSQSHRRYMKEDFIFSIAKTRGTQINTDYAESFEIVRWIVK